MPETTTTELVAAIVGGEVHRFAEIVQRYDGLVRRTVAERVSDPDTREELVQETFYRAFKALEDLDDPARLSPWLVRIARRRSAELSRARVRREERERRASRREETGGERPWVWEEAARLSRPLADVLFLRYRLGLSYAEISDRLRVPPSTVRGRLHDARCRLRAELERKGIRP